VSTPAQLSRARVDVLRAALNEAKAHGLTKLELAEILTGEANSLIREHLAGTRKRTAEAPCAHVHRASCHGPAGEQTCGYR
jgi:hypothetical protein